MGLQVSKANPIQVDIPKGAPDNTQAIAAMPNGHKLRLILNARSHPLFTRGKGCVLTRDSNSRYQPGCLYELVSRL